MFKSVPRKCEQEGFERAKRKTQLHYRVYSARSRNQVLYLLAAQGKKSIKEKERGGKFIAFGDLQVILNARSKNAYYLLLLPEMKKIQTLFPPGLPIEMKRTEKNVSNMLHSLIKVGVYSSGSLGERTELNQPRVEKVFEGGRVDMMKKDGGRAVGEVLFCPPNPFLAFVVPRMSGGCGVQELVPGWHSSGCLDLNSQPHTSKLCALLLGYVVSPRENKCKLSVEGRENFPYVHSD